MGRNGQQGEVGEQTMIRENIRTIGINENPLNQIYADIYLYAGIHLYAGPRGLTKFTNTHTAFATIKPLEGKTFLQMPRVMPAAWTCKALALLLLFWAKTQVTYI